MGKRMIGLPLILLLAGCAAPGDPLGCSESNSRAMRVFELWFGRAVRGRGDVTETEWTNFRDQVVTPNLPDGYTVLDGSGAWLNPDTHATIAETTKVLIAATPDTPASLAAIQRVRAAYKTAFHQISVGMTSHLACGSFDQ
jgi:hypothetical protein